MTCWLALSDLMIVRAQVIDHALAYDLTMLAKQCRELADQSSNRELHSKLSQMADDYEATLAIVLGTGQGLGERPLDG